MQSAAPTAHKSRKGTSSDESLLRFACARVHTYRYEIYFARGNDSWSPLEMRVIFIRTRCAGIRSGVNRGRQAGRRCSGMPWCIGFFQASCFLVFSLARAGPVGWVFIGTDFDGRQRHGGGFHDGREEGCAVRCPCLCGGRRRFWRGRRCRVRGRCSLLGDSVEEG